MQFSTFAREHYPEYRSWFDDELLKNTLGNIDEDWLEYILQETSGTEWAVTSQNRLIAVAGIIFPQDDHPYFVISNLAIHPNLRRQGLGTKIIQILIQKYLPKGINNWICYIDKNNLAAQHFIEKNGWNRLSQDADGMIQYEFTALPSHFA